MPTSRRSESPASVDSTVVSTTTLSSLNATTPEDFGHPDLLQAMKGAAPAHSVPHGSPEGSSQPPDTPAASSSHGAGGSDVASLDPELPQRGLTRRGRPRKIFRYLQDLGGLLQASGSLQPPARPRSSRGRSASNEAAASSSKRPPSDEDDDDDDNNEAQHGRTALDETRSVTARKKARKVTKACLFCKRSHMTCDEERPCRRCTRRGIAGMCVDEEPSSSVNPRGRSHSQNPSPAISSPSTAKGTTEAVSSKRKRTKSSPKSKQRGDPADSTPHPLRRFSAPTAQSGGAGSQSHAVGLGIGTTVPPNPITTVALEAHTLAFSQLGPSHLPQARSGADSVEAPAPAWDPSTMPTLQQSAGPSQLENFLNDLGHADILTPSEGFEGTPDSFPFPQPHFHSPVPLQPQHHVAPVHSRSMTGTQFTPSGMPSLMIHDFDAVPPPSTAGESAPTLASPCSVGTEQPQSLVQPAYSTLPAPYGLSAAGAITSPYRLGLESLERLRMWVHHQSQGGQWSASLRQRLMTAADEMRQVLSHRFEEAAGGGRGRGPASSVSCARLAAAQEQLFSRIEHHYRANIIESLPVPVVFMRDLSQLRAGNSHLERAFGLSLDGSSTLGVHDICSAEVTVHLYEHYLEALRGSSRNGPISVIGHVAGRRRDAVGSTSWTRSIISMHIIVDHHSLPNAIVATITPLDAVAQVDVPGGGSQTPMTTGAF